MVIINSPSPYSPAFREIPYTVGLDEAERGGEITILDTTGSRSVGVKRAATAPQFTLDTGDHTRSGIDLRPLAVQPSGIVATPEREFRSGIAAGSLLCVTPHTAGVVEAGLDRVLTDALERSLGPDEQDEIGWVASPGPVSARALFSGPCGGIELFLGRHEAPAARMVALVLNGAHLADRLAEKRRAWRDFDEMTVEIHANFARIAVVRYTLRPACAAGARLCWWNRLGGIDHHRFEEYRRRGVAIERSAVSLAGGIRTIDSRLRRTGQLVTTGADPAAAERIAAAAAAPRVWLIEADLFTPVEIVDRQIALRDERPAEISLRFEYTEVELYPAR